MDDIRKAVYSWWQEDGPSELSLTKQKNLALRLFEGRPCEDKLAGTLVFQEILLKHLMLKDLKEFALLFDRGLIADWNTCDWFCLKVLGPLAARDLPSPSFTNAISSWRKGRTLWQRRAANVAFVNLAKKGDANFDGFTQKMLETCAVTVHCDERFAQTGVGWLLRELSVADRHAVLAFVSKRYSLLSREAIRSIVQKMPSTIQKRVIREHGNFVATVKPA